MKTVLIVLLMCVSVAVAAQKKDTVGSYPVDSTGKVVVPATSTVADTLDLKEDTKVRFIKIGKQVYGLAPIIPDNFYLALNSKYIQILYDALGNSTGTFKDIDILRRTIEQAYNAQRPPPPPAEKPKPKK